MQRFQGFRDEHFIPQQIQLRDTAATLCRPETPAAQGFSKICAGSATPATHLFHKAVSMICCTLNL